MALLFDGNNQAVNTGVWDPLSGAGVSFTCMAWVRVDVNAAESFFLNRTGGELEFNRISGGTYRFKIRTNPGGVTFEVISTTALLGLGEWHHIVGVYHSEDAMHLYGDGVKDASVTPTTGTIRGFSRTNWMGVENGTSNDLTGAMEDVRMYARALTLDEIQTIYASRGGDNITHRLQGRWPLMDHPHGVAAGSVTDVSAPGTLTTPNGPHSGVGVNGPVFTAGVIRGTRPRRLPPSVVSIG